MTVSQARILAFLSDPATHGGIRPRRMDTHISAIFLAGDQVWKLKKAVTLPFLDFAPLEARAQACAQEVAINRRAAPELYLDCVPVVERDGGLAIGGQTQDDGRQVVDWLVHMRRFDQRHLFSRLVAARRVDRARANGVIEAVWALHQIAEPRPDKGGRAGLDWLIGSNAQALALSGLDAAKVAALLVGHRHWLGKLAPVLEDRRLGGKVRHAHGDLHCGNICLFQGKPLLFDAIEFSDDIACIDLFYDLAFLLMDLRHRGADTLASHAMNHYLDLSGDYQGVGLLPLFLSLRATVRAHVSASMARGTRGKKAQALRDEAARYLDEALAYLTPPPPRLLAVGGLSGSGKSRMGRELAPFLAVPGAAVVRSDSLRKQLAGVGLLDKLGPEGYTPDMTERTYQHLYDTCRAVLRSGHAAVADAVFAKPEQRQAIEQVARQAGVPFQALWLETPPELSAHRIRTRKANVSDATPDVLKRQLEYDLGDIAWPRVTTGGSKEQALADGRQAIGV